MTKLKLALLATVLSAGFGMTSASAMPLPNLGTIDVGSAQVDQVRLVCNRWGRCWHVGGYGWRGGYGGWRGRGWRGRRW